MHSYTELFEVGTSAYKAEEWVFWGFFFFGGGGFT